MCSENPSNASLCVHVYTYVLTWSKDRVNDDGVLPDLSPHSDDQHAVEAPPRSLLGPHEIAVAAPQVGGDLGAQDGLVAAL